MKKNLSEKKPGFIVIVLCGVVILITVLVFVASAAFIGDRKGAGADGTLITGENGAGGAQTDCSGLKFNSTYYPWIKDAAAKYLGGDEAALIAMIQIESSWNPNAANSGSSAAGLGQFLTSSAKGWKEFAGGDDKHGIIWPAGKLYDQPSSNPDDARFDPKRSIYAAAHYIGGLIGRYGSVGAAYQEGYHGYCKDMGSSSCQNQLAEAKKGRARLEDYYNKLKSGGGCTQPAAVVGVSNGSCLPVPYIQQGGDRYVADWCGRASQAMTINYFNSNQTPDIKSFAFQNKYGLNASTIASKSGKPYVGIKKPDLNSAISSIQKGYPVIVYTNGIYSGNHIFVLVGYDSATQTFFANDTFGGPSRACTSKMSKYTLTASFLSSKLSPQGAGNYFIMVK